MRAPDTNGTDVRWAPRGRFPTARIAVAVLLILLSVLSVLLLTNGDAPRLLAFLQKGERALPDRPAVLGPFHLTCLAACALLAAAAGALAYRLPTAGRPAVIDRTVFACGAVFLLLELYKQLFAFFVLGDGRYDFSLFPFQFCSLPVYVCLLAPLLPDAGRGAAVRRACYAFLALFGAVGGGIVMAYPKFYEQGILSLHMMVWHSLMVALGVFLLIACRVGASFRREYLPAAWLFLLFLATAVALNVALHPLSVRSGSALNLFYLSPFYDTNPGFLLIADAQRAYGWFPSLVLYALLFLVLGALPVWLLGRGLLRLRDRGRRR